MANSDINNGAMTPEAQWGNYNQLAFVISQFINKIQTTTLVKVMAVTNNGGVSPVGYVDVMPLVNQIDGNGLPTPHVTIYNVPYLRVQGGTNAIILDPVVGDIGICSFASRDISKVKKTKKQANPGSYRKFSYSDGLYIGGVLNGTPTQFVQFSDTGVTITSPNIVTVNGSAVVINGPTTINGTLTQTGGGVSTFSGNITTTTGDVTAQGTSLHTHRHGGVSTGSGTTGTPT